MLHTPTIDLAKLQAKAMNIPLIEVTTQGKKEQELKDLKKAIQKAKKEYQIEGIVSGALYSTYQRDRIEKIADSLALKIFSPLWHINQQNYMQDLIKAKFEVIITKIAAEGLDKSWLGKKITLKTLNELKELNKKNNIHLTGEGGEMESLVLDCPIFKKKIVVVKADKHMDTTNTGVLDIITAKLA